ncbi:MAG: hypothetical protein ACYS99_18110 [Planctomycetota bacterium]|jgi:hypothetical protein
MRTVPVILLLAGLLVSCSDRGPEADRGSAPPQVRLPRLSFLKDDHRGFDLRAWVYVERDGRIVVRQEGAYFPCTLESLPEHLFRYAELWRDLDGPDRPSRVLGRIVCDRDTPWRASMNVLEALLHPDVRIRYARFDVVAEEHPDFPRAFYLFLPPAGRLVDGSDLPADSEPGARIRMIAGDDASAGAEDLVPALEGLPSDWIEREVWLLPDPAVRTEDVLRTMHMLGRVATRLGGWDHRLRLAIPANVPGADVEESRSLAGFLLNGESVRRTGLLATAPPPAEPAVVVSVVSGLPPR